MSEGAASLQYAVRLPVLAKYLGQLGIMLILLNIVPLLVAIGLHEWHVATYHGMMLLLVLLLSLPAARLPSPQQLQGNEALVIVSGAFVLVPLFMTIPFTAMGLPLGDALFEAVSAITTTGLTTVHSPETMPQTFLFSRAWMQWYGGLGIVVLSVALLMGPHITARRLAVTEGSEGLVSTARTHARHILQVYLLLTFAGIAVMVPLLGDAMLAVDHVLAAVSTGGFSTFSDSLADIPGWGARLALLVVAMSGAIPLVLYYRVMQGAWREVLRDGELWLLMALIAVITLLLYLLSPHGTHDAFLHSLAMAISAQSTTGFATQDLTDITPAAKLVIITAMFIGGGLGSTAGGIKLLRLILLYKLIQYYLRRSSVSEHTVLEPRVAGHSVSGDEMQRALAVILLYCIVIAFSWMSFLLYGYAPMDALFEVVSAIGTVGLSVGITSHDMPGVLKAVLEVDMLLGRLEIVALLVLCYPPTWFGKRMETK